MEESEGNDDLRAEYLCPYCAEDYDVVSLCCHIDEHHPIQAKNGVRFPFLLSTYQLPITDTTS